MPATAIKNKDILQEAKDFQAKSAGNPEVFTTDVLGVDLWSKQIEIARSVRDNMFTAVPSCFGSGKSFVASCISWWFYTTFVPCIVITASSTWKQLKKILWSEIHARYNNAKIPLGGQLLETEHNVYDENGVKDPKWTMVALSPQIGAGAEADKAEGFHSDQVLIIMDQAHGVKDSMVDICEALLVNDKCRMLMLGNPIMKSGAFYNACEKDSRYNVIKISAFDTPNVKTGREIIPGLVTSKWVENMRLRFGEDHPYWKSKVLAEFPDQADNMLITTSWVEDAIDRTIEPVGKKGIGVDVARFGEDKTVIITMHGDKVVDVESMQGKRTYEIAGRVMAKMNRFDIPAKAVAVDDTGIGGGVTDDLHKEGYKITPINNGGKPDDPEHFADKVTEMGWKVRTDFEKGNIDIPYNEDLMAELPITRYHQTNKGKLKLESKDEMKKRGEKSPDFRDALFLAREGQKHYDRGEGGPRMTLL